MSAYFRSKSSIKIVTQVETKGSNCIAFTSWVFRSNIELIHIDFIFLTISFVPLINYLDPSASH